MKRPLPIINTTWRHQLVFGLLASIVLVLVLLALMTLLNQFPVLPDFNVYHTLAQKWVTGKTRLYDSMGRNFFNAPWLMMVLAPLAFLPQQKAAVIWTAITLLLIVGSLHAFRQNRSVSLGATVLALANLPTAFLLFNGQADAFPLAGMALGWWAIHNHRAWWLGGAISMMAIKPTHFPLVFLLYLWAIRHWSFQDWLKTLAPTGILTVLSGLLIGFDWPLRYIHSLAASPPVDNGTVVLWKLTSEASIPPSIVVVTAITIIAAWVMKVRHEGLTLPTLSIALAATFTFTVYAWNYHYILLAPALLYLLHEHLIWGLIVYLTTWTGAVRMLTGGAVYGNSGIMYPLAALVACWLIAVFTHRNRPSPTRGKAAAHSVD